MNKIFASALVLTLVACASPPTAEQTHQEPDARRTDIAEIHQKLSDGRTVTCLLWDPDAGYDSGISCDWGNAK